MYKFVKYKNHRVIEIMKDEFDRFPVRLGYLKAVKILNELEALMEFVKIREEEFAAEEGDPKANNPIFEVRKDINEAKAEEGNEE